MPFNVTVPLMDLLQDSTADVLGALIGFLRDRGNSIEILEPETARELWHASIVEVENSSTLADDYEAAIRVFTKHLGESASYDALIMPALVYRDTQIVPKQRQVKWDGVIRRYRVINYSDRAKKQKLAASISPTLPAVSLHVVVFTPGGDSIFEKYGGLDITHDIDLKHSEITMTLDFTLRERLLVDTDNLQEGFAVAFDPYFPRD